MPLVCVTKEGVRRMEIVSWLAAEVHFLSNNVFQSIMQSLESEVEQRQGELHKLVLSITTNECHKENITSYDIFSYMLQGITDQEKRLLKLTDLNLVKHEEKQESKAWDNWIELLEVFCTKPLICDVIKALASVIIAHDENVEIESKIVRITNLIKTVKLSKSQQTTTKDFHTLANKLHIKILSRIIKTINKHFEKLLKPKMTPTVPILSSSSVLANT